MSVPQLARHLPSTARRVEVFTEEDGREVVVLRTGRWRHIGIPVEALADTGLRHRVAALAAVLPPDRVDERARQHLSRGD